WSLQIEDGSPTDRIASPVSRAFLKPQWGHATRQYRRNERAEVLAVRARVQQTSSNKSDEAFEFVRSEMWRMKDRRIESFEYRLDWTESVGQILIHTGRPGIV